MDGMKKPHFSLIATATLALALASCVVPEGSRPVRQPRYVSLPFSPDMLERQFLPEVAEALEDYGYRPVNTGGERYKLDFQIDEGPLNVDSTITLTKDGQPLAEGRGRDGGPRKVFQPSGYIRRAFDRSLEDFNAQLERVSSYDVEETRQPAYQTSYPPSSR